VSPPPSDRPLHAHIEGFDLHAAVAIDADDRDALERLCRYLSRPAIAQDRLELRAGDTTRVTLRHPWSDGTTHLDFARAELIARLAAFIPRPRINLVLYHGVFAPNAKLRRAVVSYGRPAPEPPPEASDDATKPTASTKDRPGRPDHVRPRTRRGPSQCSSAKSAYPLVCMYQSLSRLRRSSMIAASATCCDGSSSLTTTSAKVMKTSSQSARSRRLFAAVWWASNAGFLKESATVASWHHARLWLPRSLTFSLEQALGMLAVHHA
jgi:Putative transposase